MRPVVAATCVLGRSEPRLFRDNAVYILKRKAHSKPAGSSCCLRRRENSVYPV
jgi:hypothetical protein